MPSKTWQVCLLPTSQSHLSTCCCPSPHFSHAACLSRPQVDHTPFWLRAFAHSIPSALLSVLPTSLVQRMVTLPPILSDRVTSLEESFLTANTRSAVSEPRAFCSVHLSQLVIIDRLVTLLVGICLTPQT